MSYEGYTQYLCKNGHHWTEDCWAEDSETCRDLKRMCSAPVVWSNMVNVTNGSYDTNPETGKEERIDGYIELEIKKEKSCDKCGSVLETRYKIPKKGGSRHTRRKN